MTTNRTPIRRGLAARRVSHKAVEIYKRLLELEATGVNKTDKAYYKELCDRLSDEFPQLQLWHPHIMRVGPNEEPPPDMLRDHKEYFREVAALRADLEAAL